MTDRAAYMREWRQGLHTPVVEPRFTRGRKADCPGCQELQAADSLGRWPVGRCSDSCLILAVSTRSDPQRADATVGA